MKLSCKIIEDMLPMYYDKVCSEESATLIEEHLKDCPHCSQILTDLRSDIAIPEKKVDDIKPLKKIQKSYKKMRMRWLSTIAAILVLIPIGFLGWNEVNGQGVAYSNQDDLARGNAFMTCLAEGDYAKAYTYLDIEYRKFLWLQDWFEEEDLVNFEADGLKKFCELGEKLETLGGIDSFEYIGILSLGVDHHGNKVHQIIYRIMIEGKPQEFRVDVAQHGIHFFFGGGSYLTDPLAMFCAWSEYLWQDYRGCYMDPDTKEYVYYDKEN